VLPLQREGTLEEELPSLDGEIQKDTRYDTVTTLEVSFLKVDTSNIVVMTLVFVQELHRTRLVMQPSRVPWTLAGAGLPQWEFQIILFHFCFVLLLN